MYYGVESSDRLSAHGTTTLFAALDVAVGKIIGHCATFGLATLGFTPLRARRNQNAGRRCNTIYLRLHECFFLRASWARKT